MALFQQHGVVRQISGDVTIDGRGNMNTYLCLLRGINVGGKNLISKDQLIDVFAGLDLENVRTYIQSGNVMFQSSSADGAAMTAPIEQALAERFDYPARAVVLAREKYAAMLEAAHRGWGKSDEHRHNALFTLANITPDRLMRQLPPPEKGIETVSATEHALFWSADKKQLMKTTMTKLTRSPWYRMLTVRNHKTVFKLRELLDEFG